MTGQFAASVPQQGPAALWFQRIGSSPAWLAAAYALLAVLLALPVLGVEVPLGGDALNHFARIHVRAHIADDPDLARLFQVRPYLVPYMGLDWMVTPMARVMPTLVAGRVAIVLLLWGTLGAVLALQRAFTGRIGFEPLLIGVVSYNALLASGFLNYVLGVVGALLGLAAWHAMRDRAWLARLAVFTAVATALYYTHLLALGLYGAMLGSYEVLGRPKPWRTPVRDWLLLGAQFAPAAALWTSLAMPAPGGGTGLSWTADAKIVGLLSPFLFSGAWGSVGIGVGMACFAMCTFLLFALTRTEVLRWDRRLAAPAATLAVLGLAVPTWAFGVYLVDLRFSGVAAYLAIASIRVAPGRGTGLLPVGVLLGAVTAVQLGSAGAAMRACDGQYAELRGALATLPRGAILDSVVETEAPAPGASCSATRVYDQMPQLVTLERSGYSPGFFAQVTGIGVRKDLPSDRYPWPAHAVTPDMLQPGTYLLWMHLGNHARPVPPGLALLHAGSFFDLFAVP